MIDSSVNDLVVKSFLKDNVELLDNKDNYKTFLIRADDKLGASQIHTLLTWLREAEIDLVELRDTLAVELNVYEARSRKGIDLGIPLMDLIYDKNNFGLSGRQVANLMRTDKYKRIYGYITYQDDGVWMIRI